MTSGYRPRYSLGNATVKDLQMIQMSSSADSAKYLDFKPESKP